MADDSKSTTETPQAPPPEGFLHSFATSLGIDPEAVVDAAKRIHADPKQAFQNIANEFGEEGAAIATHPIDAIETAGKGAVSAFTNPEAQETAKAHLRAPGIGNKVQGATEYLTSGIPMVGGGLVKSEEQAGKGNMLGSMGTLVGTVAPFLTETEGAQNIKTHLAETGKTFVESAKEGMQRAATATAPEGSLEAGFAKLGGKTVGGAPVEDEIKPSIKTEGPEWDRTHSAVVKGKKVGSVGYKVSPDGRAQIYGSVVNPELRGKGIGQKLYRSVIDEARESGASRITSDSTNTTPEANRVWEKLREKGLPVEDIKHPNGKPGYQIDFENPAEPKAEETAPFEQTLARRGQLPKQTVNLGPALGETGQYVGGLTEPKISPQQKIVEDAGLKYKGELTKGSGVHMFEHPDHPGQTAALDEADMTPENVRNKMASKLAEFNTPAKKDSDYHPDLQKIADKFGTHRDAAKAAESGASFVAPDGKFVTLPTGMTHDAAIDWVNGYPQSAKDNRVPFMAGTKAVRIRSLPSDRSGPTIHISVPPDGVTPEQLDSIKETVAKNGRYGNVLLERSDVAADTKDKLTTAKEFARPSDVEPMLKEIGAHPEQKVSPEAEVSANDEVAPNAELKKSAQKYAKAKGMPEINHAPVQVDLDRAKEIAETYDKAEHAPNDPKVKAAYDALKSETMAQFHHLRDDLGLKFEPQEKDPYNSAGEMMNDVRQNNRLKVFTGSSTGADHPLSEVAPGTGGHTYNTIFRWVHDAMGHAAGGNDFSEGGEKSATEAHAQMYSDAARPAMRAETEGQTSWFFHNPEVEAGRTQPGAFAEQKATVLPDVSHDWHKAAGESAAKNEAGGINPRTGKSDATGMGTEIMPELRQPLDHAPTAEDFKNFYDQHKEIFDKHPELRVGWDNKSAVAGGHEINVGAVGDEAVRVAKKLDQKSAFDIAKGEVVPTKGTGLRTDFPNYPIEDRIKDLTGQNQSDVKDFEHLSKDVYDNLEPDERDYLKDDKNIQRNVMTHYHKLSPSVAETTNAMQAGAALGGWWQRYIDVFHGLLDGGEEVAKTIGPSHAEVLKQWHAALSANKNVADANNLAWHSYADWLDAGKPKDRKSINDIILKNGAQPEGATKKGNAAISDTLGRRGKIVSEGLDTSKILNLVNSPEMRGERPFTGDAFRDDVRNPLMGKGEGYRKVPSMGATVAGKGNLNRLVVDTHIRDFYGQPNKGTAANYIADSVHLRQAAKALGLKGGEGQEQLWGTVLGLKTLLKEGLTPEQASGKLDADTINRIGKDYAEVIANDPEITGKGGLLDRLKDKYGIGRGAAGVSEAYRKASGTSAGEGRPAGSQAPVDSALTTKTAERIRGQISDSKIKKVAAEPSEEGDTSFNFGANAKEENPPFTAGKRKGGINAVDLIKALKNLKTSGPKAK